MNDSEVNRLHERLDDLVGSMGDLKQTVAANIALCRECRPKVLGNGKEGFGERIARLEESRSVSKTFIVGAVSLAGVMATVLSTAVTVGFRLFAK